MKEGTFRADLYYRLDVASIKLPALRERLDDLAPLIAHFVDRYNHSLGKRIRMISRRTLNLLHAHRWPGNVRELAHVIERATLLREDERIDVGDLPTELAKSIQSQSRLGNWSAELSNVELGGSARIKPLDHILREAVERSLQVARGDCARAAHILGISRPAIYRKMVPWESRMLQCGAIAAFSSLDRRTTRRPSPPNRLTCCRRTGPCHGTTWLRIIEYCGFAGGADRVLRVIVRRRMMSKATIDFN